MGKVGEAKMNLIDYNQAMSALEKECQLLINREQYGAENVLVAHALNVISELPIIRQPEIVRCKDCKHGSIYMTEDVCGKTLIECNHPELGDNIAIHAWDWFCADAERKE